MMEYRRQWLHITVGLLALVLSFVGPVWALVFCIFGILFNVFSVPRLFPNLYRREETGLSGIALYPVGVFLVVLLFGNTMWIVAGAWAILAFGDGFATMVGKTIGLHKLPYNPEKSFEGLIAFVVMGTLGAWLMMVWNASAPADFDRVGFLAIAFSAALVAGLVETMNVKMNDNLTVPLTAGGVLYLCSLTQFEIFTTSPNQFGVATTETMLMIYAMLNCALALNAVITGIVTVSGGVTGALLGTAILSTAGWAGYSMLVLFFVLGTAATKYKYTEKSLQGVAQEKKGKRSAKHAFANCGVAVVCAWLIGVGDISELARQAVGVAFVAAFATALADTLGSELGQVFGRTPFLPTTLRPVPVGTEGAISMEGTLIGLAGAFVVAGWGWVVGMLPSLSSGLLVVVAAFIGTTLESFLGATIARRNWIDNECMNLLNTLVGALSAGVLFWVYLA